MQLSPPSSQVLPQDVLLDWEKSPELFVRETMPGTEPEPWQSQALQRIASTNRVAIRSGHGVGKSTLLAWVILWFMTVYGPEARVPCTAPTSRQLYDILWAELAKWRRRMVPQVAGLFELKQDRLDYLGHGKECFASARTARKEKPEAFQGAHAKRLLFIADEASGVDDAIFEAGSGSMSTPGAKTILAGNPTRPNGYFFDCFGKDRAAWSGMCVPCSASRQVDPSYATEMARKYGEDSNVYRIRVLGEFPESEDDVVIPLSWCEAAIGREVAPVAGFRTVWGLDVARFGGDRSALAKRRANVLLEPVKSWHGKDTMQLAGIVKAEYEAACEVDDHRDATDPNHEPLAPSEILVDVIGIGAGVVDRLRELGLPARGVNVAETAAVETKYNRQRDELWWRAREWLEARDCVMPDDCDELIAELSLPKYKFTSAGKILIESKDEMKARGVQSPDLADAFCLTFAGGVAKVTKHVKDRYARRRRWRRTQEGSWMSV